MLSKQGINLLQGLREELRCVQDRFGQGLLLSPGFCETPNQTFGNFTHDFLHLKHLISNSSELLGAPGFSNLESKAENH